MVLTLPAGSALARDLYFTAITITLPGPMGNTLSAGASTNKLDQIADFYSNSGLSKLFPDDYVLDTIAVGATLNLRGVPTEIRYPADSTALTLTLLGTKSITLDSGTSRDETAELLEDWLQGVKVGAGNLTSTDLFQALVRFSPVDPVAGNPNSLQSKMGFADYAMGTRGPLLGKTHPGEDLFGIGANTGSFSGCVSSGCMDVVTIDIPINYAWNFKDSDFSLLLDFPLAATFTEGQWSALVSIALGFQYRPQPLCELVRATGCALTAGFRIGAAGSIDVGALAILYSFSLTNHMEWEIWGLRVGVANYFAYSASVDGIEYGGFELSYELQNGIFRNGGYIADSFGVRVLNQELGWEFFGADTRYTGTDLWMDSSGEVGAALVTLGEIAGARYNKTRISASYVWGRGYDGASIKLDFLF